MYKNLYLLLSSLIFLAFHTFTRAEDGAAFFESARAMGMGNAYAAIASDSSALNWNPAGLSTIERYECSSVWHKQSDKGLKHSYLIFIAPITDENRALGFGWENLKLDSLSESISEKGIWSLAYGQRFKKYSVGAKLNAISYAYRDFSSSIGVQLDTGFLYKYSKDLNIGLTKYGLLKTTLQGKEIKEDNSFKIGLAYKYKNLLIGTDIDNDGFHLGIEHWTSKIPYLPLGIRCGFQLGKGNTSLSSGLSIKVKQKLLGFESSQIDYAYVTSNIPIHYLSFSVPYEYLTSLFNVKDMEWNPMFKQLYVCTYKAFLDGKIPLGTLTVENKMSDESIKIDINLDMGTYTNKQAKPLYLLPEQEVEFLTEYTIPPNSIQKIRIFKPLIDTQILNVAHDTISPKIDIRYTFHGQPFYKSINTMSGILGYMGGTGTYQIDWDSPEMISAFITTHDRTLVAKFIDEVNKCYQEAHISTDSENFLKAMYVFEALSAYNVKYEGNATPIDQIRRNNYLTYPDQILKMGTKIVDCEEIALLYASCLKRFGIPVCFLETGPEKKRHLLVMIENNEIDNKTSIKFGEKAWLPIEVSRIENSFIEACKTGMEFYEKYNTEAKMIPINEIFVYPFALNDSETLTFSSELKEKINTLFKEDVQRVRDNKMFIRYPQ